eukprot:gene1466-1594_t
MVCVRKSLKKAASGLSGDAVSSCVSTEKKEAFAGKTVFHSLVYEACRKIPRGKVMTYKSLAEAIGHPRAFRAVGSALRQNPYAPQVPCHRVVASDRTLGGFKGHTDVMCSALREKKSLLEEEGVVFEGDQVAASYVF